MCLDRRILYALKKTRDSKGKFPGFETVPRGERKIPLGFKSGPDEEERDRLKVHV